MQIKNHLKYYYYRYLGRSKMTNYVKKVEVLTDFTEKSDPKTFDDSIKWAENICPSLKSLRRESKVCVWKARHYLNMIKCEDFD
jgi:hypothetical protein